MSSSDDISRLIAGTSAAVALGSAVLSIRTFRRGAPKIRVQYEDFTWSRASAESAWPSELRVRLRIVNSGAVRAFVEEAGIAWYTRHPHRSLHRRGHEVGWRAGDKPLLVDAYDSELIDFSVPMCRTNVATMNVEARAFAGLKIGRRRYARLPLAAVRQGPGGG